MQGGSACLPSQTPPPSHPGRWEDLTTSPCSYTHRAAAANPSPALTVLALDPGGPRLLFKKRGRGGPAQPPP